MIQFDAAILHHKNKKNLKNILPLSSEYAVSRYACTSQRKVRPTSRVVTSSGNPLDV